MNSKPDNTPNMQLKVDPALNEREMMNIIKDQ